MTSEEYFEKLELLSRAEFAEREVARLRSFVTALKILGESTLDPPFVNASTGAETVQKAITTAESLSKELYAYS